MAINFFHGDCMEYMKDKPDGYYDLAVVDPPYGGGGMSSATEKTDSAGYLTGMELPPPNAAKQPKTRQINHMMGGKLFSRYGITPPQQKVSRTGGTWAEKYNPQGGVFDDASAGIQFWDYAPPQEYFDELFRVSKNQIIWGGNYFNLPPCRCFLIWRKLTISEKFTMAMAEYAWTSFNANAKLFECAPQGNASEPRFHPTQKPAKLYKWCISLFAEKGWKLLDTHGGSMSSAVAAYEMGLDMDICEINDFYFQKGKERVEKAQRQQFLF